MKKLVIPLLIIVALFAVSYFFKEPTDQEKIAAVVQEQYDDIDQLGIGHELSLDEAEAILDCWANENLNNQISEEELREAILIVLECNEEVRNLIKSIDEIDF